MSTSKPDERKRGGRAPGRPFKKNVVEWSVFALSLVLVLALTGYLAYDVFRGAGDAPVFAFEFGAPAFQDSLYVLPVTVHNTGDRTAASVVVVVASGAEEAEVVFDYVPRHSTREGAAFFRTRPSAPSASIRSYSHP